MRFPGSFTQLSANSLLKALQVAHVQTDGSYKNNLSRTAVIIRKNQINHSLCKTFFNHRNSTESEWQSIVDGLEYSIKREEKSITLENDNLGVINSLIQEKAPNLLYSAYYFYSLDLIKSMDWVAVRWIPRELNKADKLFRI
jgi:hypothetical protein